VKALRTDGSRVARGTPLIEDVNVLADMFAVEE
jgi:hypothetical protein